MKIWRMIAGKKDYETSLLSGQRVFKDDERIEACGAIDELSCLLGIIKAFLRDEEVAMILTDVQEHLFIMGSQISGLGAEIDVPRIGEEHLNYLNNVIQEYEGRVPALTRFLYPEGSPAGALLHLARAFARRCERILVSLSRRFDVDLAMISYMNKLSKALFLL
ncbi:MAG: cob(I)yrinic acid a,c-diamide adenosyltransferase, partial [Candidatus Bathyarchaeia archaeon]